MAMRALYDERMNSCASPLITPAELAARIAATPTHLLIVDCRSDLADAGWGRRVHAEGHLPGAIHAHLDADLSGPVTATSGRHPLPAPAAFAATLARWGVTDATHVVAYDQGPGAWAARLWWMLRASGHERAQVLDGGLAAWRAAQLPLETGPVQVPAAAPGAARPFAGAVTTDDVRNALRDGRIVLVDARAADRFAGRNETIDPVAGHVPGALNQPFTGNLDANGRFLPPEELRRRWLTVLGDRGASDAVMMCGSGVTACHNLLALEQAGLAGARLYAGSWSEWIRDPARGVAT
jgi:thiosulfate/3-mercaptopyruvate sulfurtransferase